MFPVVKSIYNKKNNNFIIEKLILFKLNIKNLLEIIQKYIEIIKNNINIEFFFKLQIIFMLKRYLFIFINAYEC